MHRFSRRDLLRSGAIAAAGVAVAGRSHRAVATAPATDGSIHIHNLPKDFYARPGLADMPRIDYESLPVVSVRDYGAQGDGVTSDNAAFDAAVNALDAQGGGVAYVPAGRYLFTAGTDAAFWQRTLSNVHFVGDGESSIIVFRHPGQHDPQYSYVVGWSFPNAANISLRSLAMTWTPYFLMRDSNPSYTVSVNQASGAQFIGVLFDLGQPGLWCNLGSGYWVVDSVVRNTCADAIHFDSISESTAAYNYVEHVYDDAVANVTNTFTVADPATLPGVQFLSNTVVTVPWGRGVTLGGKGQITADNWIEATNSAGIFSTVGIFGGSPEATLYDALVRDNTMVRNNLSQRDDNAFYKFGTGGYQGSIAVMDLLDGLTIENNRIYGSETNAITLGIQGWYVAKAKDVVLRDNEIEAATEAGIHMVAGGTVNGIAIDGNSILGTTGPSVREDGTFTGVTTYDNRVSAAPVVTGSLSGDFSGFEVVGTPPRYRDVYAPFRTAADETSPEEPPAWPIRLPADLPRRNVRDFGARGDGHSNDTEAFQRALVSLPPQGGVIVVPAGQYRIDPVDGLDTAPYTRIRHHLLVAGRSNIHIRGDGVDSVLIFGSADHQGLRFLDVTGCTVSGLALQLAAQRPTRHNRALLDISAAHDCVAAEIRGSDSSGPGIRVDSSRHMLVTGCTVARAGTYGIEVAACRQTTVTDCTVTDSRDDGIETSWVGSLMLEPQYVTVTGNTVDGAREGAGIGVVGGDEVTIHDNQVRDTYLAGVYVYARCDNFPPKRLELTGNRLIGTNSGRYSYTPGAISLHGLTKGRTSGSVVISGNTVDGTPFAGLWVGGVTPIGDTYSNLDSLSISGNTITGFGTTAIDIDDHQRGLIGTLTIA